jgi:hypothetical protein
MFDIRVKVIGTEHLEQLKNKISGLPRFVSEYTFTHFHAVLNKFDRSTISNIIYGPGGVYRRTGGLGKALVSYVKKINQYAFYAEADFNDSVPYVRTHVGTGSQVIYAKNAKFLYIPKAHGPADVYPRQPVRNFYNTHKIRDIYNLATSVSVPRRINPADIQDNLENIVGSEMPNIAMRALNNWKKTNGY